MRALHTPLTRKHCVPVRGTAFITWLRDLEEEERMRWCRPTVAVQRHWQWNGTMCDLQAWIGLCAIYIATWALSQEFRGS